MRRMTVPAPGDLGAVLEFARTTGAGWDIVLLCAVIAVVITGSLLPAVVLSRVTVSASAPAARAPLRGYNPNAFAGIAQASNGVAP